MGDSHRGSDIRGLSSVHFALLPTWPGSYVIITRLLEPQITDYTLAIAFIVCEFVDRIEGGDVRFTLTNSQDIHIVITTHRTSIHIES